MPESSKGQKRSRYLVFVSHSSLDAWIAKVIVEKIEALEAECWLDEKDLAGGDVVAEDILKGIRACREVIILMSANSLDSKWVSFEIGAARAGHKRVTPILNNVALEEMAPMRDLKGIDLNKFDQFLAQLSNRIRQYRRKA